MIYSHRFGMRALRPTLPSADRVDAEESVRHQAAVTAVAQDADRPDRRTDEAA